MNRTEARESLMQLLFQMEMQKDYSDKMKDEYLEKHFKDSSQSQYAVELMDAVLKHLQDIDAALNQCSKWGSTKRMPKVDLAIARLALGEALYLDSVPEAVAINEAVDMAKKYSTEESKRFINGVLGKIINNRDA